MSLYRSSSFAVATLVMTTMLTGCFFGANDFEGSLAGPDGCVPGYTEIDGRCYKARTSTPDAPEDLCEDGSSPPCEAPAPGEDLGPGVDMSEDMSAAAVDMPQPVDMPGDACVNGVQDAGEEGVDCGGACAACPIEESCADGVRNQDEEQIDCGGVCPACPTCDDGVKNQDEEGVDCGGSCDVCQTCSDGVQNQDEEQVDCGGVCGPCPSCDDGVKNQDELGPDCGGVCAGCMVTIPAGPFSMGSEFASNPDMFPAHQVTLSAFMIDGLEVTVEQYARCVDAGDCTEPVRDFDGCNYSEPDRRDHPINCVSWSQADAYCRSIGRRLPTEAEWEKAAMGTANREFPWGNQAVDCTRAILAESGAALGCGLGSTAPVGSRPPGDSPYGVSDMVGNASEWVADWYASDYYAMSPAMNPTGPATGDKRVQRGGSFRTLFNSADPRRRFSSNPETGTAGIRCARSM